MARKPLWVVVLLLFAFSLKAEARVARFVVERTRVFAEGISFGTVGQYERLDGSPIVAPVRIEYSDRTIPAAGAFTLTLEGDPSFVSYETADRDTTQSLLTVRDDVFGTKVPIPPDRWAFGTCPTGEGSLTP